MPAPSDADRVRALTERLVACSSVSPDPIGEARCATLLAEAMPAGVEHGTWPLPDGRPVVWARVRGTSNRSLLMLGHYDTVGVDEYQALDPRGASAIAFDSAALARRLMEPGVSAGAPRELAADLAEERRAPGTWMFGRGALDMKGGLAAGIAALERLASGSRPPPGDVLFIITPDEEFESAGMLAALPRLAGTIEPGTCVGALNLDYEQCAEAHAGTIGKALLGLYVQGAPTHAGSPFDGVDAIQLAAAAVRRLTTSDAMRDARQGMRPPPPVALRLRDRKSGYNVQTALEAVVELNVLSLARPLAETLEIAGRELRHALDELLSEMRALSGGSAAWRTDVEIVTLAELTQRARRAPAAGDPPRAAHAPGPAAPGTDAARERAIDRVREAAHRAGLHGPAIVLYLLPPYYPPAAPGDGPLVRAATRVLGDAGIPVRPFYPFISDASYVALRCEDAGTLAREMPDYGVSYSPPLAAMRALDLDVVNLGPWGRDAHGRFERVHAPFAFGVLPALIERVARAALEDARAEPSDRT